MTVETPNTAFVEKALDWLGSASMDEALAFYKETRNTPGCDDWTLAELGRSDLFFLLAHVLRRPDIAHPWLYARCREVELRPDAHIDLWAREHYKSTIITFGLTIQDVLRDREVTCGIFSHTRPMAKGFLRQIKTEFETNEVLKALYPDVLWDKPRQDAPKWSEDEGIVVRRQGNPKEATVEAWGLVDGQPTGKHFQVCVYDDVVTRESVNTPEMINKTTSALELSYSLGTDGGARRFIGTRYHFNDTYRTVMERGTAKPRVYPATADGSTTGKPVLLTSEALAQKRRDMGIYTFACQLMQNPKADATHGFRREWLRYYANIGKGMGLNKYILVDPAHSKKEHADYTSIWVIGLGADENYYALEIIRDRLNLTERASRVIELHRKWRPLQVRYEEYGLQADVEHIEAEQEKRNYRFKITKVGGRTRKEERIKRLIPIFENSRFYLPSSYHITTTEGESKDMVHEFVENEFMAFPVPVHDDMLDSLARIAEPDLPLQWPAEQQTVTVEPFRPLDPAMGY